MHVKSTNFGDLHYRDPFNTSRIELNDLCTSQGLDNLDQVVQSLFGHVQPACNVLYGIPILLRILHASSTFRKKGGDVDEGFRAFFCTCLSTRFTF